ncbi:MAG: hypothetical protein ACREXU_11870 [Gammaproteobacteria bacterium]
MAYEDTWWNHQGATVAEPTLLLIAPRRGEHHGLCANPACANAGADWYNRGSCVYYCDGCARRINEQCLAAGTRKVCELLI